MPRLTLDLLGPARITTDSHSLDLRVRKELALLVYLVVEPQRQRRETLLGLLWPETSEDVARNNLRVVLAGLRRALGTAAEAMLIADRQYVQFVPDSGVTLDVAVFRSLLADVGAHAHAAAERCEACVARLVEAAELYRGDFLASFSLPDSALFEEWAAIQRERLHEQQLEVLDTLTLAHELRGDYAAQCRYARRQLTLEPWREQAHRQLMLGLVLAGDRGAALAQYEACRRILADELGIEPELKTTALYEQIRTGELADTETRRHGDTEPEPRASLSPHLPASVSGRQDWSEAPEVGTLYGRQAEVAQLQQWMLSDRCRLIALIGIGGVGKTALAVISAHAVAEHFEIVFWRSLLNAPPLDEILSAALQVVSGHSLPELPASLDEQLALLLDYLRRRRCLLILDNLESILQPGEAGAYQAGYASYGQLIQRLGESRHNSCLLLTSREPPIELARLEASTPALRVLQLAGLDAADGQTMLTACGLPSQAAETGTLVARYSGNPLALKLVAQTVQELFGGNIGAFLAAEAPIFDDIRMVLDQQYARLSPLEQEILVWLAIEREPVALPVLRANLVNPPSPREMLEALRTLQRRSLLQRASRTSPPAAAEQPPSAAFTLQHVIMEYVTARLIDDACREIESGELDCLDRYALLRARSKDYVRQSQGRIILQPLAERLLGRLGLAGLEAQLQRLLASLRARAPQPPGYAGGSILNLLLHLRRGLRGYDFSGLSVWQADLRGVIDAAINFSHADLAHSAFTAVFSLITLGFTAAGELLVAGLIADELCLWRAAEGHLHELFRRAGAGPRAVAFSQDSQLLATCGLDYSLRVWFAASGECLHTLHGHTGQILTLAFSADRQRLASSSRDRTVRIWDLTTGQLLHGLYEYATAISALAFSTDGTMLAGGGDRVICLWDTSTGQVIRTLLGHSREIECFAFTADDQRLVSGAHDGSIRLWDVGSGQTLRILQGHSQIVRAVSLHPDGHTLASGGADRLVRLWDLRDGQILRTLFDHGYEIVSLAFSADGQVLASGSADPTVKIWDTRSGNALDSFRGHGETIRSVYFSPNGQLLASSDTNGLVQLWAISEQGAAARGQMVRSLQGHTREVRAVVFSPDGRLLASAGADQVVHIWDVESGVIRQTLRGHTNTIKALAFHPDGQMLASGGSDQTIRLWPIGAGAAPGKQAVRVLRGHTDEVSSLAFSPNGRSLLSSSLDHTARLWTIDGGQETQVLTARGCTLSGAVFSPDGQLAMATAYNGTVHAWDVVSGQRRELWSGSAITAVQVAFSPDGTTLACMRSVEVIEIRQASSGAVLQTLRGHRGAILSIAFSSTQPILASSGWDGTIRIWDVESGACLDMLHAPGPYAGMNITGVTGISDAQKAALVALGAVDGARLDDTDWSIEHGTLTSAPTSQEQFSISQHNLPTQLTSFIGRDREIADIRHVLSSTRLVTLTGSGGCGKTRLAIQAAAELTPMYADGVRLIELAPLTNPALLPQVVAASLGLREASGQPLIKRLVQDLGSKQLLLVLDNCEHLTESCRELAEQLLHACPQIRILATSREILRVAGEVVWPVPPLATPDATMTEPDLLMMYESIQLFVERARAVHAGFTLTTRNARAVVQICQRLDSIPLAIELAAARARHMAVEAILARLDDRFSLLTAGSHASPRQQTLRAAIDWSYALLTEPERACFRRLAVFAGSFTLPFAEAVVAERGESADASASTIELLAQLIDKSLVVAEHHDDGMRYRLLESLRAYAQEKLAAAGEAAAAQERHLACFLQLAEEAEPHLFSADQVAWLDTLAIEHNNLRAAIDCAMERANAPAALRLVTALRSFWYTRGHYDEGRRRILQALALPSARSPTPARASALNAAGAMLWAIGEAAEARQFLEEALAIGREAGDPLNTGWALLYLGTIAYQQHDYPAAQPLLEAGLADCRIVGLAGRRGVAWGLIFLGDLAFDAGEVRRAQGCFEEAVALLRALADAGLLAYPLRRLGRLALGQGDFATATAYCTESMQLNLAIDDRLAVAACLAALAAVAVAAARAGSGATQSEDMWHAARLCGAVTAQLAIIGAPLWPADAAMLSATVAAATAQMGEGAFAAAAAEGRSVPLDQLIERGV